MGFVLKKIPENLYKFYPFDDRYNNSRLTGKVFLATPFLFNDPSDCRIGISNNISELKKDECKIKTKLEEIGLSDDKYVVGLLNNDVEIVEEVWNKQLSKLGVLCLSQNASDKLFWGYYTNNDGFCVEYDGKKIIERIVIAYINCLDYELTEHLFKHTNYSLDPNERCKNKETTEIDKAVEIFNGVDFASITNPYLRSIIHSKNGQTLVRNFIINICLKRFGCNDMIYQPISKMKAPKLFYTGNEEDILDKYYTKTEDCLKEFELLPFRKYMDDKISFASLEDNTGGAINIDIPELNFHTQYEIINGRLKAQSGLFFAIFSEKEPFAELLLKAETPKIIQFGKKGSVKKIPQPEYARKLIHCWNVNKRILYKIKWYYLYPNLKTKFFMYRKRSCEDNRLESEFRRAKQVFKN